MKIWFASNLSTSISRYHFCLHKDGPEALMDVKSKCPYYSIHNVGSHMQKDDIPSSLIVFPRLKCCAVQILHG